MLSMWIQNFQMNKIINSTEDPQLRQQLRWLHYLERLYGGAWGDHIAVQGLVDIHIISTLNPDMELIRTSHNTPVETVYLGLIGQFHYHALERMDVNNHAYNQSSMHEICQPESFLEEHTNKLIEDQSSMHEDAQSLEKHANESTEDQLSIHEIGQPEPNFEEHAKEFIANGISASNTIKRITL